MGIVSLTNSSQLDHVILIEKFKSGESQAFEEIVNKYQSQVYNIAYNFLGNCEDAYDISQEVFIKVFKSINNLKNDNSFFLWLKRITLNTCTDFVRRKNNEQLLDKLAYIQENYYNNNRTFDKLIEMGELKKTITKAVYKLPLKQREVFMLRHYEELSLKDIAKVLGCSLGTVKAHLFRATRKLRILLMPYLA
ncbi:MAG: RNA polymerase sigma factor [Candidatus Poribacteria bacterium]